MFWIATTVEEAASSRVSTAGFLATAVVVCKGDKLTWSSGCN